MQGTTRGLRINFSTSSFLILPEGDGGQATLRGVRPPWKAKQRTGNIGDLGSPVPEFGVLPLLFR